LLFLLLVGLCPPSLCADTTHSPEQDTIQQKQRAPRGWGGSYHFVPGNGDQCWKKTSIGDVQLHAPTHIITGYYWGEVDDFRGILSSDVLLGLRFFHASGRKQIQNLYGYPAFSSANTNAVCAFLGYRHNLALPASCIISAGATCNFWIFGWIQSSFSVDISRDGHRIYLSKCSRWKLGYGEAGVYGSLGRRFRENYLAAVRIGYDWRSIFSPSSPAEPLLDFPQYIQYHGPSFGIEIVHFLGQAREEDD
jgi:hypothetical protein